MTRLKKKIGNLGFFWIYKTISGREIGMEIVSGRGKKVVGSVQKQTEGGSRKSRNFELGI